MDFYSTEGKFFRIEIDTTLGTGDRKRKFSSYSGYRYDYNHEEKYYLVCSKKVERIKGTTMLIGFPFRDRETRGKGPLVMYHFLQHTFGLFSARVKYAHRGSSKIS